MRIEPTDKSAAIDRATPAQVDSTAARPASGRPDRVELSALSQAVAGLAPGRLTEIQSEVSAGTYQVDASQVSRRIVDFYLIPLK
jgi:anti-sigma28 factor (negative regulator of flagellin synthesis)